MPDNATLLMEVTRKEGPLCPYCAGSLVGAGKPKIQAYVKGLAAQALLGIPEDNCIICGRLISRSADYLLPRALEMLSNLEYDTIKAAVILPPRVIENEDRIRARYDPPQMISVRVTTVRWLDTLLEVNTGRSIEAREPDVLVTFNMATGDVDLRIAPVFIYGRYRKLERGISQSRPICPRCGGRGCEYCGFTGRILGNSVEGLVGEIMKERFQATNYYLHGAGREDVDARMLGTGRPFVMELVSPKRRKVDLSSLEREINEKLRGKVEVEGLRYSNRAEVVRLKTSSPLVRKKYRALVVVNGDITDEDLEKVEKELSGALIRQRTPKRVAWRRADLVRIKRVYEVRTNRLGPNEFELFVTCDGGLYVKELVSGDDGRTRPSVAEVLRKKAFCRELDVLEVLGY